MARPASTSRSILGYPLQTIGVIIFFAICGLPHHRQLRAATSNPLTYAARQAALRIFPALVVVVVLTALRARPAGHRPPAASSLPDGPGDPCRTSSTTSSCFVVFGLPGVWGDLPYPAAVNGSLWTLFVEFLCYLAAPLVFIFPRLRAPASSCSSPSSSTIRLAEVPIGGVADLLVRAASSDAAGLWVYFAAGAFIRFALSRRWSRGSGSAPTSPWPMIAAQFRDRLDLAPTGSRSRLGWLTISYAVLTIGLASYAVRHPQRPLRRLLVRPLPLRRSPSSSWSSTCGACVGCGRST